MKSKYCILMVLAVILINCILYGCSEKNQNISELPDGISIKKFNVYFLQNPWKRALCDRCVTKEVYNLIQEENV